MTCGQTIENQVVNFINLFSSSDDSLGWFYSMTKKNDSVLGQIGAGNGISLPTNYKEKDIAKNITALCNVNGQNSCDFLYNTV